MIYTDESTLAEDSQDEAGSSHGFTKGTYMMRVDNAEELIPLQLEPPHRLVIAGEYNLTNEVTLSTKDCRAFLKEIPTESAALIFTSPPYNIGKEYEERLTLAEYKDLMRDVIAEAVRVVRPGGSICFQVGNFIAGPQRPKPLAFILDPIFSEYEDSHGVMLRNAIVWHFEHGQHAHRRFSGRYETILWYTKGDNYVFNLDEVRVPQKYPGKKHFKGEKKGEFSGNPRGKNPGDVWIDIPNIDNPGDVWIDIPNVKANHVEKTEHPCQFPVGLAKRMILALTHSNDLVIDPFSGVGSTAVAALLAGRRAAGSDLNNDYVKIAWQRVIEAAAGTLRVREDKPIHAPSPTSCLTRVPEGFWKNTDDQNFLAALQTAHPLK